jgi:2-dehydro-3-deoxygluconokinase
VFDPAHPTGVYFKDPGHGVRYYRAGSAAAHLTRADAEGVDVDGVALLHVSGITAAISTSAAGFLEALIDRARRGGVRVSVDVNHRAPLWDAVTAAIPLIALARRADVVFVGRDEAAALWGTTDAASVRALLPDVPELVVKDSEVGATVFTGANVDFAPSPKVEVVEAVGAGDAFAGGYLSALLEGKAVGERLRRGHERAALTLRSTSDFIEERIRK